MKISFLLLLLPIFRYFFLVHSNSDVVHRIFVEVDNGSRVELQNVTELENYLLGKVIEHMELDDQRLARMIKKALENYDGRSPPKFGHGPIVVRVQGSVLSPPIFLQEQLKLLLELELVQEWHDARLILNTPRRINLSPVQAAQLWKPKLVFEGPGTEILSVFRYFESHQIRPNGTIRHVSRLTFSTRCPLVPNINFPFDQRHCNISLGSSAYSLNTVVYKWANVTAPFQLLEKAREVRTAWIFPSFSLIEHEKVSSVEGLMMTRFSRVKIQLLAVRDYVYDIQTLIIPLGVLVILAFIPRYFIPDNLVSRLIFGSGILGLAAHMVLNRPRPSRDAEAKDSSCLEFYCFVCLTLISGCLFRLNVIAWPQTRELIRCRRNNRRDRRRE